MNPEWTVRLSMGNSPNSVVYHESENVVVVTFPEDEADGPGIEFLDAQTGSSLGTVQIIGECIDIEPVDSEEVFLVNTDNDHLYAIAPRSAAVQWQTKAPNIKHVTKGRVYSCSGSTLWAYDLSTGTEMWEHVLPDSQIVSIHSLNSTLYVEVGEYDDRGLVALDPTTGNENWYYKPGDVEKFRINEAGLYVTRFASDDRLDQVARIDERTGAEQWSFTCASKPLITKTVDQSLIVSEYINGSTISIDKVSGTLNWRSEVYSRCNDIWLGDSTVYMDGVGARNDEFESKFHALDLQTGRTKWAIEIGDKVITSEIFSGTDDIYIGTQAFNDEAGTVYKMTERTGKIEWQSGLNERINEIYPEADPILIQTSDESRKVYGLDHNGQPVWSLAAEDTVVPLLVTDERVVIQIDYGEIHILERTDGHTEVQLDDNLFVAGRGAFFFIENGMVSAYPVAAAPEAFQDNQVPESSNTTKVFSAGSEADDSAEGDNTKVFESNTADDSQASPGDPPPITFCPSCGTDLSEFDDVQFCPRCGSEIP